MRNVVGELLSLKIEQYKIPTVGLVTGNDNMKTY